MKRALLLISVLFISACVQSGANMALVYQKAAESYCKQTCLIERANNVELSNGPCLGDPVPNVTDWACDVAHDPRTDADNNPTNQCQTYISGQATHFVEIDTNCNVIRSQ